MHFYFLVSFLRSFKKISSEFYAILYSQRHRTRSKCRPGIQISSMIAKAFLLWGQRCAYRQMVILVSGTGCVYIEVKGEEESPGQGWCKGINQLSWPTKNMMRFIKSLLLEELMQLTISNIGSIFLAWVSMDNMWERFINWFKLLYSRNITNYGVA